jgi:hypothetical protein
MKTYRFEQFKTEIIDPTISVDVDSIAIQPSKMTISVDILLITPQATFGIRLEDISCDNMVYEGQENVLEKVLLRLKDFEI